MRRALAALAVALAGLGGAAAGCTEPGPTGSPTTQVAAPTAPTTIDTYSLVVGECIGSIPNGSAAAFTVIPCDKKHYWEAFAHTKLAGDDFPGAKAVDEQADKFCQAAYKTFVGVARSKSRYQLTYLQPTRDTWTSFGDRDVVCLAGRVTGGIAGSLENAEKSTPKPSAGKK